MVVLAIVGLLIALTFPVISQVRRSARTTAALAGQKENLGVIFSHAASADDMPPVVEPDRDASGVTIPWVTFRFPSGRVIVTEYFAQMNAWTAALVALKSHKDNGSMGDGVPPPPGGRDRLSHAFMATPEFFVESAVDQTVDQLRPIRLTRVSTPDRKGTLIRAAEHPKTSLIGFTDGHASALKTDSLRPTVPNSVDRGRDAPVITTLRGVRGRDI